MKNALLIAAVAMLTVPAMASKARLKALNSAPHLEDTQEIFSNASKVTKYGEWLTFEMGPNAGTTAADVSPRAEGGFVRNMGDASYGFYLGHKNVFTSAYAAGTGLGARQSTYLGDENPIDLFYGAKAGELSWGVGLHYSNSDKKQSGQKQSSTSLNAGVSGNNWDAAVDVGLVNTYKSTDNPATAPVEGDVDFKGTNGIQFGGTYTMDTLTFVGAYGMNGGKEESGAVTAHDINNNALRLGVVNSHKAEGSDFFYGVDYVMITTKDAPPAPAAEAKTETTMLPVYAGIEANANSWLVLRASVSQNFLIGSTKTNGGDANTIANNTEVAAGAGLKFNKILVDGTLKGNTTGDINGNSFLANAALTYMF